MKLKDKLFNTNGILQADSEELEFDPSNVITCENLVKIYKTKDTEVVALQGLDLDIKYGEMMAIIGNSGSGKSTLLNM
ncbi:MAG: ATP-binding cassette domain-containing protein, partial [Clostridiales bacterium]|nr:ATP-binding cassette domain-containing protein [Clostridiales bacterium]